MQNVNVNVSEDGKKMTIEVDLSQELGMSKSNKSMLIATTGGNAKVPKVDGMQFGLNVYKKV